MSKDNLQSSLGLIPTEDNLHEWLRLRILLHQDFFGSNNLSHFPCEILYFCNVSGLITSRDNLRASLGLITSKDNLHGWLFLINLWASPRFYAQTTYLSSYARTHHFLFRGVLIWITPSLSLKYSNFPLARGLVNTSDICSSLATYGSFTAPLYTISLI